MTAAPSRFGVNLLTQFILALLCISFASQLPSGFGDVVALGGALLMTVFLFGVLYSPFRMFGTHDGGIERFYQRFPLGLILQHDGAGSPLPSAGEDARRTPLRIDWNALCSFHTLRFCGALLVITSLFSLLFTIDWELLQKITAAGVGGLLCIGLAEWLRRSGKNSWAALFAVFGFALLQFTCTLLWTYAVRQGWSALLQHPHTWLTVKFLLTCAMLWTLWRYPSDLSAILFFAIAWITPFSLAYVGATVDFPVGVVFIVLQSALTLGYAATARQPGLWVVNTGLGNLAVHTFFTLEVLQGGALVPAGILALLCFALLLAVHLGLCVREATVAGSAFSLTHRLHVVIIHVLAAIGMLGLRTSVWWIGEYWGFGLVIIALFAFVAAMAVQRAADRGWNDLLLNIAIIFSAIGLFIQTEGQWTAVAFLVYACIILWLSLYAHSMRTRAYGFLVLLVAMVKLYWEFASIFESIPGAVAVLAIGIALIALSYKFEALKATFVHGMRRV